MVGGGGRQNSIHTVCLSTQGGGGGIHNDNM